jgi:arylsulfatase A-like enzyme
LIVWGPKILHQRDHVDQTSVFSAIDLVPTLLSLTGTPFPEGSGFDGESLVDTLLGDGGARSRPISFRRPPDRDAFYGEDDLPDLAVRSGNWKLLCEYDGSSPQLFDLSRDPSESTNVADAHQQIVEDLTAVLLQWHQSMPPDNGATYKTNVAKKRRKGN